MAVFVKKKLADASKSCPLPTVKALSASNSPSALSALALDNLLVKTTMIIFNMHTLFVPRLAS